MTLQNPDVLIVGGGHNGLTAASYLAKAGRSVTVLEASPRVGGMTATTALLPGAPSHRINEGAMDASLIRTASVIKDLDLARHGLREVEADPPYAWLDEDGSSLCIWRDPARTAEELRRFSASDARAFLELSNTLDSLMNMAVPYMNTNPVRPRLGQIARGAARSARHPSRLLSAPRLFAASHAQIIEESFSHRSIRALLAALPCFAPISQDGTGWVLVYFGLIHRAGVGRYVTGTGAITDALQRCLLTHGGQIRCDAVVEEILVRGGRAVGVRLADGEELHARAVITTSNAKTALTDLLPAGTLTQRDAARAAHIQTAGTNASSFKVDLALSGRLELTEHQANRHDDVDLRKPALCYTTFEEHVAAWDACARGEVPEKLPMITIIPSAADPSQAPEGQDTLWSWTGIAAADPKTRWADVEERTGQQEVDRARRFLPGIEQLEIARQVMTPPKFAERFRVPDGNVYHVDPTALRFGPMRPAIGFAGFKSPVPGLYLSGGSMHPSAGICGVPGKIAAEVALRDLRSAAAPAPVPLPSHARPLVPAPETAHADPSRAPAAAE
jgi:phytoene dehydrogenase-like protein